MRGAWVVLSACVPALLLPGGPCSAGQPATKSVAASKECVACHNGLTGPDGQDLSIGVAWAASMMGNAARDPYWHAAVRREVMSAPSASAAIEAECSKCHMPMAHVLAQAGGGQGHVFGHLPVGPTTAGALTSELAHDGVSCSLCHQIGADKLGSRESFVGGFVVDSTLPWGKRPAFGPHEVDAGRQQIMRSATGFVPQQGLHLGRSEVCATCHTLYTHSLSPQGEVIGELPEQVPYLEWQHSAYRDKRSCQDCHMPTVAGEATISSVMGVPRKMFSQHVFRGGNFFMAGLLNRFRDELGVTAQSFELSVTRERTIAHLQASSATLTVAQQPLSKGVLRAEVTVTNLAGHKLPTAYPSRRVWLHVTIRDRAGAVVFESGAPQPDGTIAGNDNDESAAAFEPHYELIDDARQVQIYETILGDPKGAVTTGLLAATRYLKDNRVVPKGFVKAGAPADVAVTGAAAKDADFDRGVDSVQYAVAVDAARGPFEVQAELWYQPIGYRWAHNLGDYDAVETKRLVRYFDALASSSAVRLAQASTTVSAGASAATGP